MFQQSLGTMVQPPIPQIGNELYRLSLLRTSMSFTDCSVIPFSAVIA
jgi:hypothetical protein